MYTTVEDYQESISVDVYQGERLVASENIQIGGFVLEGIEIAKAEIPSFEITFSINIDGILCISCIDLATKASRQISIQNTGEFSRKKLKQLQAIARSEYENDLQILRRNKKAISEHYHLREVIRLADKKLDYCAMSEYEQQAYELARKAIEKNENSFSDSNEYDTLISFIGRSSREESDIKDFYEMIEKSSVAQTIQSAFRFIEKRDLKVVTSDDLLTALFDDRYCSPILANLSISKSLYKRSLGKIDSLSLDTEVYDDLPFGFSQLSRDSINLLFLATSLAQQRNQELTPIHLLLGITCYYDMISTFKELDQIPCIASSALDLTGEGILTKAREACYQSLR